MSGSEELYAFNFRWIDLHYDLPSVIRTELVAGNDSTRAFFERPGKEGIIGPFNKTDGSPVILDFRKRLNAPPFNYQNDRFDGTSYENAVLMNITVYGPSLDNLPSSKFQYFGQGPQLVYNLGIIKFNFNSHIAINTVDFELYPIDNNPGVFGFKPKVTVDPVNPITPDDPQEQAGCISLPGETVQTEDDHQDLFWFDREGKEVALGKFLKCNNMNNQKQLDVQAHTKPKDGKPPIDGIIVHYGQTKDDPTIYENYKPPPNPLHCVIDQATGKLPADCEAYNNDPDPYSPDKDHPAEDVPLSDKIFGWLADRGLTPQMVEYAGIGGIPVLGYAFYTKNVIVPVAYVASVLIGGIVYEKFYHWEYGAQADKMDQPSPWDQKSIWDTLKSIWDMLTGPPVLIAIVGIGGSVALSLGGSKLGLPDYFGSNILIFGFVGTILLEIGYFLWNLGIEGIAELFGKVSLKVVEGTGKGLWDGIKDIF